MKIVAAVTNPDHAARAAKDGADIIELRLDLWDGDPLSFATISRDTAHLPMIATLRSMPEGGKFMGNEARWEDIVRPLLPLVDYVDIEEKFQEHAAWVRHEGKTVIASMHMHMMPSLPDLFGYERMLRSFGDIPKIVVQPESKDDVINLISFTHAAQKPVCTSIMGELCREVRAMLPFFGSELVYCHTGEPTAHGQYSVAEFRQLAQLLGLS
jgi:3-dehydroquinate dehydratase-1